MRILVPYATSEGQTESIAQYIAEVIRAHGHEAEAVDLTSSNDPLPGDWDGVVVGSSIHMGKHDKALGPYVERNLAGLQAVPSAFFSVSLAAHGDELEAEGYVAEFEKKTGWQPDLVALFAGALLYTHYGFVKRHVMKQIARHKPGNLDTDTSRDYVYTEWDGVRRFAEHFLELLSTRASTTP